MADCLDLDRVAPTRRPAGTASGSQTWRELLFVHWSFAPEVVRAVVPPGLALDLWGGRAWIGVVPFRMEATRAAWMPRRLGLEFLETNVRTYVHHDGAPGVYFLSLEAASWLAVQVARRGWGLPYFHATMHAERTGERVAYRSRRRGDPGASLDVTYDIGAELGPSLPGTQQHFLLERYYLFAERRGRLRRGQVHHHPYPARRATVTALTEGLVAAAGLPATGAPETIHYSAGVEVEVFGPHELA
jgi:uncharacterized protein YqjF (DUF2071 family)